MNFTKIAAIFADSETLGGQTVTVGGWAIEMFDGYPQKGDSFDYQNLRVTIDEVDDLRITQLVVQVFPKPQEDDQEI